MSEIDEFSRLQVIVITFFGRGGSFFLHGLFDGHNQVCTLPFYFPFYSLFSNLKYNYPDIFDLFKCYAVKELDSYDVVIDMEKMKEYFLYYLSNLNRHNEKDIFLAFHYSWSKIINQDINRLKVIVWHPHAHNKKYEDLILSFNNKKIILVCRHPLDSIISAYNNYRRKGYIMEPISRRKYIYNEWTVHHIAIFLKIFRFYYKNRNISFVIKSEIMNKAPEETIMKMAGHFGLEFNKVFMNSTFCGKPKKSESTRGYLGFDSKINVKLWNQELKEAEIVFLELLFYFSMKALEYHPTIIINKRIFKNKILRLVMYFVNIPFYRDAAVRLFAYAKKNDSGVRDINKCNKIILVGRISLRFIKYYTIFLKNLLAMATLYLENIWKVLRNV